jgi:signal transduction histidine kinase/ActR/RegA family two-component response regulator
MSPPDLTNNWLTLQFKDIHTHQEYQKHKSLSALTRLCGACTLAFIVSLILAVSSTNQMIIFGITLAVSISFLLLGLSLYLFRTRIQSRFSLQSIRRIGRIGAILCFVWFWISCGFVLRYIRSTSEEKELAAIWTLRLFTVPIFVNVVLNEVFLFNVFVSVIHLAGVITLSLLFPADPEYTFLTSSGSINVGAVLFPFSFLVIMYIAEASNVKEFSMLSLSRFHEQMALQRAQDANDTKRRFISYIFHELRVPLNAVSLSMGLVDSEDQNNRKEILGMAKKQLESITNILDDALSLQKIEEGKFEICKSPADMHKELQMQYWSYFKLCEQKGLQLSLSILPEFPRYLIVDKYRLRQVLSNLISNAMKFTHRGGSITVKSEVSSSGMARISVTDTGIGISPENQKRLFQAYSQVAAGKDQKGHGTGLGLNISKNIVHLHGGTMGVESERGKGSCFWFEIPITPVSPDMIENLSQSATEKSVSRNDFQEVKEVPRILVVDDSSANRILLQKMIVKFGYECECLTDGAYAVELFRNQPEKAKSFHVIIMDEEMAEMNGHVATKTIRDLGYSVPIIAHTGYAFGEQSDQFTLAGANFFLSKPVTVKVLKESIEKALCSANS